MALDRQHWNDRVLRSSPEPAIRLLAIRADQGQGVMLVDARRTQGEPGEPPKERVGRRYWTKMHIGECPVCGKDRSRKERVYDKPPPTDPNDRIVQLTDFETYCGCLERQ